MVSLSFLIVHHLLSLAVGVAQIHVCLDVVCACIDLVIIWCFSLWYDNMVGEALAYDNSWVQYHHLWRHAWAHVVLSLLYTCLIPSSGALVPFHCSATLTHRSVCTIPQGRLQTTESKRRKQISFFRKHICSLITTELSSCTCCVFILFWEEQGC